MKCKNIKVFNYHMQYTFITNIQNNNIVVCGDFNYFSLNTEFLQIVFVHSKRIKIT